ncbi:hypothetical protein [Dyadobacter sp. LHD-138]|uniref:hypothetical protein n=1 Tax=Dyadobacter sp. LHD-138 TaxID=3071413 RepID=UPI0027DF16F0|nr:hypothetical protein [Dyadobacter sp. LHD-138]MDQ6477904.1 hypothetical protein [Dyadobacter sp. LHD-138]
MKAVIKKTELDTLLADSENALRNYLYINGKKYPTDQWVTVAEYCNRFNIPNTQTVSNWIKRGIVPSENTLIIAEYNNIRLIKAVPYQDQ